MRAEGSLLIEFYIGNGATETSPEKRPGAAGCGTLLPWHSMAGTVMLRRGAVLVLCAFLGSVRHARGQLSGCSMVKLFGLNSNNTQSRTMGEYVSRPDGGFPVYHSVSQRLSLWYDDKRKAWQVSDGVRDSAGRALLLAHSTAKRADAIAPMGGHWLSLGHRHTTASPIRANFTN